MAHTRHPEQADHRLEAQGQRPVGPGPGARGVRGVRGFRLGSGQGRDLAAVAGLGRAEALAVGAVLLVGIVLRAIWIDRLPMEPESDYAVFYAMAQTIAEGNWRPLDYGWVYQGAGYPALLAPILALGGDLDAVRVVNLIAQIAMILCVWLAARRLFGPPAGLVAGALAAVSPGIWAYTPLVAAENVAFALLSAVALLLIRPRPGWPNAVTGLLVATLALTRPAFLPFAVVAAVVVVVAGGAISWSRLRWFALGMAAVAVPVLAANKLNDGPLLPVGAAGWQTWLVNNERATGAWFNAAGRDDYPFTNLGNDAETRAAQQKLGLQFVVANPWATVEGMEKRHRLNWNRDDMGLSWTLDRAPAEWRDRVPLADRLADDTNALYTVVVALAAIAAIRHRRRLDMLLSVGLPLAYIVAVLAVAEANGRYHAVALPLLCILASGAVAPVALARAYVVRSATRTRAFAAGIRAAGPAAEPWWRRSTTLAGAVLGVVLVVALARTGLGSWLAFWRWDRNDLPPWLILIVAVVPLASVILAAVPAWTRWFAGVADRAPRRTWAAAVAGLAVVVVAGGVAVSYANRTLDELAAVAPSGWDRVQGAPLDPGEPPLPLLLQDSGTAPGLREVSYPDAALLPFASGAGAGTVVALERTLGDLQPGEEYRFYLQVYDPGTGGDPGERLAVLLDGQTVWERSPGTVDEAAWVYLSVPWVANGETVTIRVERAAGAEPRDAEGAVPAVRTLHLYPTY